VAKAKRELRDDFETTVLATEDDSRQDRIQPLRITEGARVRLKDVREPARVSRFWPTTALKWRPVSCACRCRATM